MSIKRDPLCSFNSFIASSIELIASGLFNLSRFFILFISALMKLYISRTFENILRRRFWYLMDGIRLDLLQFRLLSFSSIFPANSCFPFSSKRPSLQKKKTSLNHRYVNIIHRIGCYQLLSSLNEFLGPVYRNNKHDRNETHSICSLSKFSI
uniref:Uncharacterized protein n=1 Tax=Lutzomyia longipalpis TaxID=7200 RepID=A0A1B0GKV8_LUTLO